MQSEQKLFQAVQKQGTGSKPKSISYEFAVELHKEAAEKATRYRICEAEVLEVLIRVEQLKIYEQFELTSLKRYCVDMLGLSGYSADDFICVARKSVEVPAILEAIYSGQTTVSKIRKISSVVTKENAVDWIGLTIECSCRVVEKAVAMKNPRAAVCESLKYVAGDVLELKFAVSEEWASLLKSTKDRLSQRERRNVTTEEALFILMKESHERHDPVEKAQRAKARTEKALKKKALTEEMPRQNRADPTSKPTRYRPANVRHEVTSRDQGQCVHVLPNGRRCENRRWIDQHHIIGFAQGGEHAVENLETLCSVHHKLRHIH